MRFPLRIQLLVPMLSIVFLAITLATVTSVYLTVTGESRRQAGQLRRVVATVTEANPPLTGAVLRQLHGLSGGEFVLLDSQRRIIHGTVDLGDDDRDLLRDIDPEGSLDSFSSAGVTRLSDVSYFADLIPVRDRIGTGEGQSLLVLYPKDRWWSIAREVAVPILSSGGIAMVVGGVVIGLFAGRFARPIKVIGNQAMTVAAGQFRPVTVPSRDDEIADLATSINVMTEKLSHYEDEVRRSERMRTLGQLGAGMAHQLRNSATGARMAIELHRRECAEAAASESTSVAMRELCLMESYLQRFLDLGRWRQLPHERVELQHVVDSALELVRPTCRHAGIDLVLRTSPQPMCVEGDAESLHQLLVNLVLNAVEAAGRHTKADARIIVEVDKAGRDRAALRVRDSGPGPAAAVRDDLFEPFVTEKPDGTGLGLYVARQIAEAHQGSIRWERLDEMTCFCVEIPLCDA